jgi:hypothetical protein
MATGEARNAVESAARTHLISATTVPLLRSHDVLGGGVPVNDRHRHETHDELGRWIRESHRLLAAIRNELGGLRRLVERLQRDQTGCSS